VWFVIIVGGEVWFVVCDLHMRWGEKKFVVVREKANGQFGNYEVK
jgi:hypothetical protein